MADDGAARIERVARVLRAYFGLGIMQADHVVLTASHRGSALVGVYWSDDVDALVADAVADANARDLPLRLTVSPAPTPPPRVGLCIGDGVDLAVTLAWQQAARQHHRALTAAHLLHALLCDPALTSLWARAGGDAAAIAAALEAHLAPASRTSALPTPSATFGDALLDAVVAARRAGHDTVEDTDLLAAIVPKLRALLAGQRITADTVIEAARTPVQVPGADTRVVFHNDDVTKMELVTRILTTVFEKPKAEAEYLTLRVHHVGWAIVGRYAREVAEAKVTAALAMARDAGSPLHITAEAAGGEMES
jgi:ATP-dependent Clp protease adaptor protein ClpS